MPLYEYAGRHPEIPPDGEGVVRPREIREFDEAPRWGSWRELDAGEAEALTAEPEEPGWRREPAPEPEPGGPAGRKGKLKAGTKPGDLQPACPDCKSGAPPAGDGKPIGGCASTWHELAAALDGEGA